MENSLKWDNLGVPLFSETSTYTIFLGRTFEDDDFPFLQVEDVSSLEVF